MGLDFDVKKTLEQRLHSLEMRLKEVERLQEITHLQYQKNISSQRPYSCPLCLGRCYDRDKTQNGKNMYSK